MCTEVNSAMGLQATAATKRKRDISFDNKDTNTYTNCPPPIKTSKWSMHSHNYVDAMSEELSQRNSGIKNTNKLIERPGADSNNLIEHNNNNNESKRCSSVCSVSNVSKTANNGNSNGKEVSKPSFSLMVTTSATSEVGIAATTPLPPTSNSVVPEDSIAKLEVVAAVPCEPWAASSSSEPLDCISKLQAVAVPSDPWGSIATRSTLATTLLNTDELDDDDDFEDDYEEEESIIPTYCPLRYHAFPAPPPASAQSAPRFGSYSPAHGGIGNGYPPRPNYYSEPFPQQNCSRTVTSTNMRLGSQPPPPQQWPSNGLQHFYAPPEVAGFTQQQHQQTIRCAENGKSYLELGCSPTTTSLINGPATANIPANAIAFSNALDARHTAALKRCCDGRGGTWCSPSKNCYKDIRLKIRNLSMFKLSRFRQVSEQSLYRSVLICNTLKRIDREMEAEAKELHLAQAVQQNQHQLPQQFHQSMSAHHLQHSPHHQQQHLLPQQAAVQLQAQQHQLADYAPAVNCARLANVDYLPQPQHLAQHFSHQSAALYHNQNDRLEALPQSAYHAAPSLAQKSAEFTPSSNAEPLSAGQPDTGSTALHPYDHYPFRDSQSGRATPFPCQPVLPLTSAGPTSGLEHVPLAPLSETSARKSVPAEIILVSSPATIVTTPTLAANDSGFADDTDDTVRAINWSSVLSLSSQSALDNEIFAILPTASVTTSGGAQHSSVTGHSASPGSLNDRNCTTPPAAAVTTASTSTSASSCMSAGSSSTRGNGNDGAVSPTVSIATVAAGATFTTLSTISSATATHSLTSSYVSSAISTVAPRATWEYGFLDMDFGLGTEFTELAPSCKISSDDLFKSGLTPVTTSRFATVHDNELEQPAHILVGS